jgi:hypothetical protein
MAQPSERKAQHIKVCATPKKASRDPRASSTPEASRCVSGSFKGRRSVFGSHRQRCLNVGQTAACSSGEHSRGRRSLVRKFANDQPVMPTERQVPAYQFAAAALEEIGDGLLSILWFGEHAFDGVSREFSSGDVDGHGLSPPEVKAPRLAPQFATLRPHSNRYQSITPIRRVIESSLTNTISVR